MFPGEAHKSGTEGDTIAQFGTFRKCSIDVRLSKTFLLLTAFASMIGPVDAAPITHVADILANPTKYDGQRVSVAGTVTDLEEKTSHAGNAYDVFSVCDHGSCVHAFIFGRPAITEGKTVTAAGTFAAVKHVGSYTFRNEIDLDEGSL